MSTASAAPVDIQATLADRGSNYGDFAGHSLITQNLKAVISSGVSANKLNVSQMEALDMIAHKIGRIVNGNPNYADSWVDIAGYATLISNQLTAVPKQVEAPEALEALEALEAPEALEAVTPVTPDYTRTQGSLA